jgi:hypothetical protein
LMMAVIRHTMTSTTPMALGLSATVTTFTTVSDVKVAAIQPRRRRRFLSLCTPVRLVAMLVRSGRDDASEAVDEHGHQVGVPNSRATGTGAWLSRTSIGLPLAVNHEGWTAFLQHPEPSNPQPPNCQALRYLRHENGGMGDELEWLHPLDENGLWEHQGRALTVGSLIEALRQVPPDRPVQVAWYDGTATRQLHPMHLDVRASSGQPVAVVLTVS